MRTSYDVIDPPDIKDTLYNCWRIVGIAFALCVCVFLVCVSLVGCAGNPDAKVVKTAEPKRMEIVSTQAHTNELGQNYTSIQVLRDKETGQEYLIVSNGRGVAVCRLEGVDK